MPNRSLSSLAIVAPFYNEEAGIGVFYESLNSALSSLGRITCHLIFVDDGSTDETLSKLNSLASQDERITVISLSRNFGHQIALTAGLEHSQADAVIMLDSDLQHPPALIPKMVHLFEANYDIVSAVRGTTVGASLFKRASSVVFYKLLNVLSDTTITPGAADFCLLSYKAHQALLRMPERHRFLRGMIGWIGFNRTFVYYDAERRIAGSSKYDIHRMFGLARDAVLSFSATPARLATRLGVTSIFLSGAYLTYVLVRYFFWHDLERGWGSLISVLLLFGGVQLAIIGIIGEYIAQVYEEVKGRPLYIMKQSPDEKTLLNPEVVSGSESPSGTRD